MRVIAGTCRSMPLVTPTGDGTRPTTDRIKETLFNILQTEVPGAVFCDFFAGRAGTTGSFATENRKGGRFQLYP